MLALKWLDPVVDRQLFIEAYNWRSTPKRHIQPDRLPLEAFTDTNPTHLTIGLFNGELVAVYFLVEWAPRRYEAHFTSRKGVSRETLLTGAREVLDLVLTHGGEEVSALIRPANRPLRQFVGQIGMNRESFTLFTCVEDLEQCNFAATRNQRKVYIKYVKMKESLIGPLQLKSHVSSDDRQSLAG